ncbi:MAG: hypothetical protein KKD44_13695 [Proteobacteria bacterium]|nr:hypothetical protein [Pseudomonadota bacterium]
MKNRKALNKSVFQWVTFILLSILSLSSCGGGSSNNPTPQDQRGEWDTMTWDQSNWQ